MKPSILVCLWAMVFAGCGNPTQALSASPDGKKAPATSAKAAAAPDAPGSDCPKTLTGYDEGTRTVRKACGPVTVSGVYDVEGTLILEAGAVLLFRDGAELDVGATRPARLVVAGTEGDPVLFSSAGTGDGVAGSWKGVRLFKNAARPELVGLVIQNAGDEKGALYVEADAVTLRGSTVRNARDVGVFVDTGGRFADLSGNRFATAGRVAISVPPAVVGSVGVNRFDEGAFVQVRGGTVDSDARWQNPGAPYVIAEDVSIDGKIGRATVEVLAGVELRFRAGAGLDLGGATDGALLVSGTADKPVVFTAADERKPGAWKGVSVRGKASARIAGAAFSFGGSDDKGVVRLEGGTSAITATKFIDNACALSGDDDGTLEGFAGNDVSASSGPAIVLVADQVGGLGPGNRFASGARIEVTGGSVKRSATWCPQGVPYEITGETLVGDKATLTLAPDVELAFKDGQSLGVGYYSDGTLKAIGSAQHPIRMHGLREGSLWSGVSFYTHALGCEVAHLEVTGVAGDAGLVVAKDATARISDVLCTGCAATVASECGARLTISGLRAGAGTPKTVVQPVCE